MADITYSVSVRVDKGFLSNSVVANGVTATMDAAGINSATYTLSGTPTSISTANLTSVGLGFFRNLSASTAATCSIGVVSGGSMTAFAAPRAGEVAVLRLQPGATYQATGSAGTRLRVDVTEG